jgi:hypothetical protein
MNSSCHTSWLLTRRSGQWTLRQSNIRKGAVGFNTLVTTLTANVHPQDLLSSTKGSVAANLVQVYKALGGGWEIRGNRDPVEFLPADMKEEMRQRTRAWQGVLQ